MSTFFFYNNLMNTELIKKINNHYTIQDGYVIVESHNKELSRLKIGEKNENKNTLLKGKIVHFNIILQDVLEKINEISECKNQEKIDSSGIKLFYDKYSNGSYGMWINSGWLNNLYQLSDS